MSQANVSRPKAVRALKNNNNDIVNAIMVRCVFFSSVLNSLLSAGKKTLLWWFYSDFRSSEFYEAYFSVLRGEKPFIWNKECLKKYANIFFISFAGIDNVRGPWQGYRKVADLTSFIQFIPKMEIKLWLDKLQVDVLQFILDNGWDLLMNESWLFFYSVCVPTPLWCLFLLLFVYVLVWFFFVMQPSHTVART